MSDENFAGQQPKAPTEPKAQDERPEDLSAMFDEVKPEDFSAPEPPRQSEPEPEPAPQAFNGYGPNIEAKKRELAQLREKLAAFRSSDIYVMDDGEGNRNFDFAAFYADQARADAIKDEIDDLKERARDRREASREQQGTALQLARVVLNEKLGRSAMPKAMKDKIVRLYRQGFDSLSQQGWWATPQFGDRGKLRAAIGQLLDTVIGRIAQESYAQSTEVTDARGMDDLNGGGDPPAKHDEQEEDDEFMQGLMSTYGSMRGNNRFKTIGDLRRAERERSVKGGS